MEFARHRIAVIALVLALTFPTGAYAATLDNASILNVLSGILTTFSRMLANMPAQNTSSTSENVAAGGSSLPYAAAQRINNLSNVTVSGVSGLKASDIPDLSSSYLPLSGGTVAGDLMVTGAFTGGSLSLSTASTTALVVQNATSTNFFSTNASTTNATSTNLFASLSHLTTGIIDTLTSTVANITNLIVTTITGTNATFTNATSTNATSTNAFMTNLRATNSTLTNATSTNFFSTNASTTNATSTNLFAQTASLGSLTLGTALPTTSGGTGQTTFSASQVHYGSFATAATSSIASGTGITVTNGASAFVIGAQPSFALANIAANSVLANITGSAAAPTALATSSLGVALSDTTGVLAVTRGGTGISSFTANSLLYSNAAGTSVAYAATSTLNIGGTASNVTGTVLVANGGTGSTTLSGLLKGAGTGQVATAVGGTDYEFPLSFSSGVTRSVNAISLDLTRANTWTGLQQFSAGASSTQLSVFGKAYFGGTATTTIDSAGNLVVAGTTLLANATSTNFFSTTASSTNLFAASAVFTSLLSKIANGCYNTDQYSTVQSAITAAGTSGCVNITPLTTDTGWWYNPSAVPIIDQRATSRVGQFLGGASVTPKLANFANGGVANKKIVYFGNSTVWNANNWYIAFAQQDIAGGILAGMNIHQDIVSVAADSSGNVTVILSSPSGFTVGQFVSVEPTAPSANICIGSGIVTAVSGNQFTYTGVGTATQCTNLTTTSTGGVASQQLLNFGGNGATLTSMLADTSPTSTGIGGICAVKPDLLIIRGPLINDVRAGGTTLSQAIARERQLLDTIRSCSPNTDILLKTENSLLTTDVGSHGYVTPNSSAQAYSAILEQAITAFTNVYPNVVVLDTQATLYGTTSPATSAYMADQLHPSASGHTAEAQEDIQILTQLMNGGFQSIGPVDPSSTAVVPFSPYLAQNARANSYTQPWTFYSHACADPNYYTLIASGTGILNNAAGQTYFRFNFNPTAAAVIQSFDVVEQQSSGCWQLLSGSGGSSSGGNTQVNLGSSATTPYPTYTGEQTNVWRPKYIVQAAEPYVKNTTTYTYHRRIMIQSAGSNYFRIQFLPNEGLNAAISDIQTGDILVLNASTSVPLSNCSGFTPSIAGSFLQCNITGDQSSLTGQYGWVFGAHPMEGQSNSSNQTLIGGSSKTAAATLTVWGTDTASTSAFLVSNSASTTVFSVFNNGNATYSGALFQSSDLRLKNNVSLLDSASSLALVEQLNPVSYTRIDQPDQGTTLGFIAQEVQKIFPALVSTTSATALTPDGTLTLNYTGLISPLTRALQALAHTVSGFTDSFTTKELTFTRATGNELCLADASGKTCITKSQLDALLAGAAQSASGGSIPETTTAPDATPPVITINGDNPAHIHVGDTYADIGATVADNVDQNLGLKYFLNGALVSNIVIDTSAVATDTIDYVAADNAGNTATSTRTVIIEGTTTP